MPIQEGAPSLPKTAAKKITTKLGARKMLELSAVSAQAVQRETMGTDVDVQRFALYLSQKVKCDLAGRIMDASVTRSIEASSVLSVTVNDYDRALLNSGLLYNELDVELDGLWFRLTGVDFSSQDNQLVLTFSDREIEVLRTYKKWRMAKRSVMTRAEFVNALIQEVREFPIETVIPYLHTVQLVEKYDGDLVGQDNLVQKGKGIPDDANQQVNYGQEIAQVLGFGGGVESYTGKYMAGEYPASDEQIANARVILQVGDAMEAAHPKFMWRKIRLAAMMAAIHESRLRNTPYTDPTGMGQGIDDFFQKKASNSPLIGYGAKIVEEASQHNVDPRFIAAISGGESTFGTAVFAPYAAWGTLYHASFTGWEDSISYEAQYLEEEYINKGLTTVQTVGDKYCPVGAANDPKGLNKNWVPTNTGFLQEMGGDPNDITYQGGAPPAGSSVEKRNEDALGLFQMGSEWGSKEDRLNPETAARMFYTEAMKSEKRTDEGRYFPSAEYHNRQYELLCVDTLFKGKLPKPGSYGDKFSRWKEQSEFWVTKSGTPGGEREMDAQAANNQEPDASGLGGEASGISDSGTISTGGEIEEYYFYRGTIEEKHGHNYRKKEDSWTCILRLAREVNWRAFFVSGVFYFLSEDDLIKQQPLLTFNEFMPGVRSVEGNFYQKKQAATLTITVDVGRWSIPPGCVVDVEMLGVFNGKWLISEYSRSLFDLTATVTLVRERPKLPEPLQIGKSEAITYAPHAITIPTGAAGYEEPHGGTGTLASFGGDRKELATQLLKLYGKTPGWTANGPAPNEQVQMQKVAAGSKLTAPHNEGPQDLDTRVIGIMLWLIQQGFTISLSALCENHPSGAENPSGHSNHWFGKALDIDTVNGQVINQHTEAVFTQTFKMVDALNGLQGELRPAQLISKGYGMQEDSRLIALCLPAGTSYSNHTNHVHIGYEGAEPAILSGGTTGTGVVKMDFSQGIKFSYIATAPASYSSRSPFTMDDLKWIVIHMTEGAADEGAAENIGQYFANGAPGEDGKKRNVCAHYTVDSNSIVRSVADTEGAYATGATVAGNSANRLSISIEHCGEGEPSMFQFGSEYYQSMLKISAELTGKLAKAYGIPAVHLTPAQISAGDKGFVGHADFSAIAGSGSDHTDPGGAFPWNTYLGWVQEEMDNLG